jgi:hypothetical protein
MKERLEVSTTDRNDFNTSSSHSCVIPLSNRYYNVKNIKLVNAQIPLTFYAFNSSNNIIHTNLGNATIIAGNYNANELCSHMKSILDTATSATWTITYSKYTNKFTFVCTSAYIFQFSNANSACYNLGFPPVNTTSGTTNTSTRSINITGELNCYLRISQFSTPDMHTVAGVFFNFKIPITQAYNNIEFYENQGNDNIEDVDIRCLSILNVKLLKYDGTDFDLNNSDFSFLLELETNN